MSQPNRPKILIFCDYYLPGFKSGGGLRTLVNTVERLGEDFDFHIVTRDHDGRTDRTQYRNVKVDEWNQIGKASVIYLSRTKIGLSTFLKIVKQIEPEAIYLNSVFSSFTVRILALRRLGLLKRSPVVLAPEGELADGALQLKSVKKKVYLKASSILGFYNNLIWKAASQFEAAETLRLNGGGENVFIAPNMPPKTIFADYQQGRKRPKEPGTARFVYLSRIHPTKNLKFLLSVFDGFDENIYLDVYGPVDGKSDYAEDCFMAARRLSGNIKVDFKGEVGHEDVAETLVDYDFFVLPTLGESFGHVIIEALASGCPLIISDRTPWIDLEAKGLGWEISLDDGEQWSSVITQCVEMDNEAYSRLSANVRDYAVKWLADKDVENATRRVLEYGVERHKSAPTV